MADPKDPNPEQSQEKIDSARRRLLIRAMYVPPAVIGIVSLAQGCVPGSCAPLICNPNNNPCHPNQPCNPRP